MPRITFERLPEDARLWIFSAERELSDSERARLLQEVDGFIDRWTAHGVQLTAGRDWRYNRFLFVGVDEAAAGVSGCSIDALVRRMKLLQEELRVELVNQAPVLFRDGDAIERVSRERFAELADAGNGQPRHSSFRQHTYPGRRRPRGTLGGAHRRVLARASVLFLRTPFFPSVQSEAEAVNDPTVLPPA